MPSSLRLEIFTMPAAALEPANPLPALGDCLPYRLQDRYDRDRRPRGFKTAILENEILRATFLLELGGRLWSLIHKPSGRELLYRNPVFQPGALAYCNAWFSGGIEWNCGVAAHTPLTCSPLFAALVRDDDGSPVLRLYEFERVLQVTYQMDFRLPAGSPWLFARMRLTNPRDQELPMYWWSNIAVAETPGLRVLAPADAAFKWDETSGAGKLERLPIPRDDGVRDATYPCNHRWSSSFFFDIPKQQRPWEAALDKEGRGLVYASTSGLRGRKLFLWGMSSGGRHWPEFLSVPNHVYVEIQGGVEPTQHTKFSMPAGSARAWLEAYGLMEADPQKVHGPDWTAAWRDIDDRLERSLPAECLEQMLNDSAVMADRAPAEILFRGGGWGALENERRRRAGEPPLSSAALVFDEASLGPEQAPWLALLRTGVFPEEAAPVSWMTQPEWRALLENVRRQHWLVWLHLGVLYFQAGDIPQARQAWEKSLALRSSGWAWRNLGVALRKEKRPAEGANLILKAYRMLPELVPLAVECCQALLEAERCGELLELLAEMPPAVRAAGRIRVLEARAALGSGDLARAERIMTDPDLIVPDLREGELLLSETWYGLQEQKIARQTGAPPDAALRDRVRREFPPPKNLDFRMAIECQKKS
jgi:tetratricopeptide (TPR) repeat protein